MSDAGAGQASRDRLYARYISTHQQDSPTRRQNSPRKTAEAWIRRYVVRLLPPSLDAQILDVGCGAGEVVELLRATGYRHVRGVDVSSEQVARARERGIDGIELEDLRTHLRCNEATYDVIAALDVLEHFDPAEVLTVLDLVAAALRPGGMFLASVPNGSSPFMGRYRYGDFTHGTAFTDRSLGQLLRTVGIREMRFLPVNPVPHGALSSVRFAIWQVIAALLKFSLAVETGVVRGHLVTQTIVVVARCPSARS
jgi:2-polyprenyl-3-methyl-5-hydroxy-6-metoxy-1,4-benzoquinol methylase